MKLVLVLALLLTGCASNYSSPDPTPFTAGETVQTTYGCRLLILEVEAWNAKHPDKPKRADC